MMLGLNSGTRVALLLMWASCVVTALHLPDESAELSLAKAEVVCTNSSDCRPFQECLNGVCSPARQIPGPAQCCPQLQSGQMVICIHECYADDGCPGIKMCCSNGCGYVCKIPSTNCP
ncbi:uncharacterized protein LOC143018436 [Oratosquilla oratoria]|uniref:uncharacterized protein LOC143018436 n=1 Tax=Oratosquilla oratoria TaxID=337810 RepID=UPI003F77761B